MSVQVRPSAYFFYMIKATERRIEKWITILVFTGVLIWIGPGFLRALLTFWWEPTRAEVVEQHHTDCFDFSKAYCYTTTCKYTYKGTGYTSYSQIPEYSSYSFWRRNHVFYKPVRFKNWPGTDGHWVGDLITIYVNPIQPNNWVFDRGNSNGRDFGFYLTWLLMLCLVSLGYIGLALDPSESPYAQPNYKTN